MSQAEEVARFTLTPDHQYAPDVVRLIAGELMGWLNDEGKDVGFTDSLFEERSEYFGQPQEDRLVAVGALGFDDFGANNMPMKVGVILYLVTDPQVRRQRHASRVVDAMERAAAEAGAAAIKTSPMSEEAHALFAFKNYTIIPNIDPHYPAKLLGERR